MRATVCVSLLILAGGAPLLGGCLDLTDEESEEHEDHDPGAGGANPPKLVVLERSDTTLKLRWDAFGDSGWYSVDVLVGQPGCGSFPEHETGAKTPDTTLELTGLLPSTTYHLHVHTLDEPAGRVAEGSRKSQTAFVATLPAGSAAEPVAAEAYEVCA